MKSGNLNYLEPSGALQVCNGTDLFFVPKNVIAAIDLSVSYQSLMFIMFQSKYWHVKCNNRCWKGVFEFTMLIYFDVLLTVHVSTVLLINQLDAQILVL